MKILTVENKKEARFLRKKADAFDFKSFKRNELRELIKEMRKTMKDADGIGLSANQIGANLKLFVAEIPANENKANKFYAVFNPEIIKKSSDLTDMEEGCLSVPQTFGLVSRHEKITVQGLDSNGKTIKIKAWGLLAKAFQHEIDHLNGVLFIDKAKSVQKISKAAAPLK